MEAAGILRPILRTFSRRRRRELALADVPVARREGKREKGPEAARRPQPEFRRLLPSSAMERESTVVASRWANAVAGAGSVRSSAGTYTAWTDVIEPLSVEVMRSCMAPISVPSVG